MDPLVDETGQAYAYTGDDPVNAVDQLGLCTDKNGVYLVPGVCDFSNPTWVQNAITNIHEQYAPPGYWDQVGHNFEDFADSFVGDPQAYPCRRGLRYLERTFGRAFLTPSGRLMGWKDRIREMVSTTKKRPLVTPRLPQALGSEAKRVSTM